MGEERYPAQFWSAVRIEKTRRPSKRGEPVYRGVEEGRWFLEREHDLLSLIY